MRARALLAATAICCMPAAAAAQVRPQPGSGDPRIQTIEYQADQVVLLQGMPGYQITVQFAPDERIENVAVGDSGGWQVTSNRAGDLLFVKPIQSGSATNMTVATTVRLYSFELAPLYGAQATMAYTVRFTYPNQPSADERKSDQPPVEGRYRVTGARAIRPDAISDDGVRTFIEWRADQSLPAVYTIGVTGVETLVDGTVRDGVFVIDSVASTLVFRRDKLMAQAKRTEVQAKQ